MIGIIGLYLVFNNSLIIQWGTYTISGDSIITLPTSFSNNTWVGVVTYVNDHSGNSISVQNLSIWNKTLTTCTIRGFSGSAIKSLICIGY